jgi:peptidyl-prolyl cis-trans isomerase A (cyclophilin A)
MEIDLEAAPVTAANFLRYIDENRIEGATFYRIVTLQNQPNSDVKIEVIQGGLVGRQSGNGLPPIEHETTEKTGILHKNGVISMARMNPGSASSEFFVCVGDQPELDYGGKRNPDGQGFAAFGRVIEGMEVVHKIHRLPVEGQYLKTRIRIESVSRKSKER